MWNYDSAERWVSSESYVFVLRRKIDTTDTAADPHVARCRYVMREPR
ncbi:hypothetical protein GS908_26345 [Rhodococcus hoagii]|nr:hypothetical protein [Prescottella equi]